MTNNIILLTDSYKLTHARQYPEGTTQIHSYFEARSGARFLHTVFFGLSAILQKYFTAPVTRADVNQAADIADMHLGPGHFNREGWLHIVDTHGGKLPLRIWSVDEGSVHAPGTPLFAVENTDPKCWWLTNVLETVLSHVWYPSTVSSLSFATRRVFMRHIREQRGTVGSEELLALTEFMLHDFGCRGVSSMESAEMGGMAHLVNFRGTDTVPALVAARKYYGGVMPGFSVPASEHSTMTSWGRDGELGAYINMLRTYPEGVVSIVADSWDIANAVDMFCGPLRDMINARKGKTVIRPDSGDPQQVNLMIAEKLWAAYGGTYVDAESRYRKLPANVGILQGDGMTIEAIDTFLTFMGQHGWAAENWVFGMGGGLLQKVDRDTQRFAMKCSSAVVGGSARDVFKAPKSDPSKSSKKGRQVRDNMKLVFDNGALLNQPSWGSVVRNTENALLQTLK